MSKMLRITLDRDGRLLALVPDDAELASVVALAFAHLGTRRIEPINVTMTEIDV
jgi:hypothetical protein